MLIDLHTHTKPWSEDSSLDITELIQRAKQTGFDAVCVTDHDYFWNKDTLARISQEHDFLVLPGVEMNTEEGHILVFGVEKYVVGMWHADFLRRVVDGAGGFMILAHPGRRQFYDDNDFDNTVQEYCQKPISHLVDTIEVCNGRAPESQNKFAQELCRRLNRKGTGGSDAHYSLEIPSGATIFERKVSNVGELITELKAGRFKAVDLRQNH